MIPVAAMTYSRLAAGAGTALLVVGAVVVFKPSPKLSADSFVSAAFTNIGGKAVEGNSDEISKLPVCPQLTAMMVLMSAPTTAVAFAPATMETADWTPAATPDQQALYVLEKPCICGAYAATTGRQCEASGTANPKGQSYRPRCDANEIPTSYTAGCWCGDDDVFTTANTDKSVGPGDSIKTTPKLANDEVATETQLCTGSAAANVIVCLKGEKCNSAGDKCIATVNGVDVDHKRVQQKYAWAIPKIEGYDDTKLKICMSTNLQKRKCVLSPSTSQTGNVPECKDA